MLLLLVPARAIAGGPLEVYAEAAATADAPAALFDGKVVWRQGSVQVRRDDDDFAVIVRDGERWYSPGARFYGSDGCDAVGLAGAAARQRAGILWITLRFRCGHARYAIVFACQGGDHPECARIQAGDGDEGGSARIEGDHAIVRWGKVERPVTVTF